MIAAAVLDADDLHVRIFLHPLDEAVAPVDAGAARLVVGDDRDFARFADQLGELVGGERRSGLVVGRRGGERNVAVDTRVERDDRNLCGLRFLEQRDRCLAVERGEADRLRVLGERRRQHVDLLVDHRFGLGPFEADADFVVLGCTLGAGLHRLPELVLEALGDQRDVGLLLRRHGAAQTAGHRGSEGDLQKASLVHSCLLVDGRVNASRVAVHKCRRRRMSV